MAQMKVKDLIEALQKIDPELPLYCYKGMGEFEALDNDYAGHWMNHAMLMRSKNDSEYVALSSDPVWSKHKEQFEEPFKAVRFW